MILSSIQHSAEGGLKITITITIKIMIKITMEREGINTGRGLRCTGGEA